MFRIQLNNSLFLLIVDEGQAQHRTPVFVRVEQFVRLMLANREMVSNQMLYLHDRLDRLHCIRIDTNGAIVSSELCSKEQSNWFKKLASHSQRRAEKVGDKLTTMVKPCIT